MANSMIFLSVLKSGTCSSVVEPRLLRFWEARSFRPGGELKSVDMLLMDARVRLILDFICSSLIDEQHEFLLRKSESSFQHEETIGLLSQSRQGTQFLAMELIV